MIEEPFISAINNIAADLWANSLKDKEPLACWWKVTLVSFQGFGDWILPLGLQESVCCVQVL